MKLLQILALLACVSPLHATDELTASREGRQVVIRAGRKEILHYQAEPGELPRPEIPKAQLRGGYIQSIHTPSGRLITDDFPANHLHHHGVWNPWTKTEFEGRHPDFWNTGAGTGRVEFVALDSVWQKDDKAGFQARHQFVDLTVKPAKVALLDTWAVSVSVADQRYIIDFTSTQTCATDSTLKLPEYRYGGFGFRGNGGWNGAVNSEYLSDTGLTDRVKLDGSRAKWCWVGGKVDGQTCGVTILCHPQNFRFPQPVRVHPEEPFFCFAPQQLGDMSIAPGDKYNARYRLVITDNKPDAKAAEAWWEEYGMAR